MKWKPPGCPLVRFLKRILLGGGDKEHQRDYTNYLACRLCSTVQVELEGVGGVKDSWASIL